PAIFVDATGPDDHARAVAAEVGGVEVVPLHTGSLTDTEGPAPTLVVLLLYNARLSTRALGGWVFGMDWLSERVELAFQQRALVAGVLAAVALALVGTWVVIRGMAFLGDALVHGVVPGIALAVIFDFNPLIGAAGAALVMILGINYIRSRTSFG